MAEQDVKDASAGVLKELRRFQKEKEGDLKRYMVAGIHIPTRTAAVFADLCCARSLTPNATLTGRRRMPRAGGRRKKKLRRLRCDRIQNPRSNQSFHQHLHNILNATTDAKVHTNMNECTVLLTRNPTHCRRLLNFIYILFIYYIYIFWNCSLNCYMTDTSLTIFERNYSCKYICTLGGTSLADALQLKLHLRTLIHSAKSPRDLPDISDEAIHSFQPIPPCSPGFSEAGTAHQFLFAANSSQIHILRNCVCISLSLFWIPIVFQIKRFLL